MGYKYPTPQLLFKAICNAIRSKTGNSDEIPHQNIPDELDNFMNKEEYNRFIDIIEGTSFINDRITTVKDRLFYYCTSLTTVDLPECTSIGDSAFSNCTSLTTVDLPKCTTLKHSAFSNCTSLTTVDLPKCTTLEYGAFGNCTSLTTVDLPKCTTLKHSAFSNCTSLTTIILSNNQVTTLSDISVFTDSSIANGTGYIYVPDNLVDSYKTATNWSTYANQIKPLSELPSNLKEEYGYD
jgi:Leucine-rich repeat (LRR) protein